METIYGFMLIGDNIRANFIIIHKPEKNVGPFGNDCPYENHDSRVRENSEVVMISWHLMGVLQHLH